MYVYIVMLMQFAIVWIPVGSSECKQRVVVVVNYNYITKYKLILLLTKQASQMKEQFHYNMF